MANQKIKIDNEVTKFLDDLKPELRKEIEQLRNYILNANVQLTENIKWNGPNYCIDNHDRITMRIHPTQQIQLIFHRGAKVQKQPEDKQIKDASGLLTWRENDRAIATFKSMAEIENRKQDLQKIVKDWVSATSK